MKTLEAFWHWFENEKPTARDADEKAETNLSPVAFEAFTHACEHVCIRAHYDHSTLAENREWALLYEPVAARTLSLSICPALEAMHGEVAEPAAVPSNPVYATDELGNWAERAHVARARHGLAQARRTGR